MLKLWGVAYTGQDSYYVPYYFATVELANEWLSRINTWERNPYERKFYEVEEFDVCETLDEVRDDCLL